jgi:hypothetical protein
MGVRWESIPEEIRVQLEKKFFYNCKKCRVIELSELVQGSSYLGYRWYKNSDIRSRVFDQVMVLFGSEKKGKEYTEGAAGLIYGLGKSGLRKEDLPGKVMKMLLDEVIRNKSLLNVRNLSNIIYG